MMKNNTTNTIFNFLLIQFLGVFLYGCSFQPVILEDVNKYNLLAESFTYKNIPVYVGKSSVREGDLLAVYIEGDGRAWVSRKKVSDDPTPSNSLVLRLMQKDNRAKVYLARPCMYVQTNFCNQYYWTEGRHHESLVKAMNKTVDSLKDLYDVSFVELIGHSGGGAMAVLMAKERLDVKRIITVAGNLDIDFFTKHHRVTKMKGSLNPIHYTDDVRHIPQWHVAGGDDDVIPAKLVKRYVKKAQSPCVQMKVFQDYNHFDGWLENWQDILNEKIHC